MKLPREFYTRQNTVLIAKELLGKVLYTRFDEKISAGIITETEAYAGETDRASHAYGGRRTNRTETMYSVGGTAYVYLCYGMHHLFNVVTNEKNIPHAVLIRGIKPLEGIEIILIRRGKKKNYVHICSGPGTVSQGLGINTTHTGINLLGNKIWIEDKGVIVSKRQITKSPRIGVDYAGADALLPYRFLVNS
ncbi:MAG: DNA-3-methyladenine glycosylase [Bacteroidetes bacterium]|nr:DNA-3-methyladenine glycosylase [Bacteroidota bacterium]